MCLVQCIQAQSIPRKVIAADGNSVTKGGISLTYTIGEAIAGTVQKSNNSITQGFQQGSITVARMANAGDTAAQAFVPEAGEERIAPHNVNVVVYPNPAIDHVSIRFEGEPVTLCQMYLTDATGKLIETKSLVGATTRVEFSTLAAGRYFLQVKSADETVNAFFKIVKQ